MSDRNPELVADMVCEASRTEIATKMQVSYAILKNEEMPESGPTVLT